MSIILSLWPSLLHAPGRAATHSPQQNARHEAGWKRVPLQILREPVPLYRYRLILARACQPQGSGKATGCHSVTGTTAMAACSWAHASKHCFSQLFWQLKCCLVYKVKLQICFNMVKLFFKVLPRLWYAHLTHALNPCHTTIWGEQVNLPPQRLNSNQNQQHP